MYAKIVVCLFAAVAVASAAKLPKSWAICKRNDPKLNECFITASRLAIKNLKSGNSALGIPSFDPLSIKHMEISDSQNGQGPISLKFNLTGVKFTGLSSMKFSKAKVNWDTGNLFINASIEEDFVGVGDYVVKGKVLLLPLVGSGKAKLTLKGLKPYATITGTEVTKGKEKYFQMKTFDFNFSLSSMSIKLDNLFNGDKVLGENMNRVLNESWEELLNEIKPSVRLSLGTELGKYVQHVFSKIPMSELAPQK